MDHFKTALFDLSESHSAFAPPLAVSVAEGAQMNLVLRQTGAPGGPWNPSETPYMVEPMNSLASRNHEATVFVGPARTGKTAALLLGWLAHTIVNDSGDMLFIQMTQDKAREFSKTDISRAINNSPAIHGMLSASASDRNTHDVMFKNGAWIRIAWPTVSNVSGSTYRYVAITDIDRMENADNVDGEGPLFDLAKKRTQTFLSRGMTLVESSPGKLITDPNWRPATPHEAPPTGGILSIYNRSDRRRLYWKCPDCRCRFEAAPGLKLFSMLPSFEQLIDEVRTANIPAMAQHYAKVVCPECGSIIAPTIKSELNSKALWVPDGVRLNANDEPEGEAAESSIRGYWLGGVAAAFQPWRSILTEYLLGVRDFALNGSEEKLKNTTNVDQGAPYMERRLVEAAANVSPTTRASIGLKQNVVPEWTRCVVASVDVQGGIGARFEVQVHAIGPYMEQQLVTRFPLKLSMREGMGADFAPIDPAKFPEDWDVLTEKVLRATWRTPDSDREIRAKLVVVDTGGEGKQGGGEGVTHNAYAWWRRLRVQGMAGRVMLFKGSAKKEAPVIKESLVGARGSHAKGDVPLFTCNTNLLADQMDAGLRRSTPGPGYIHLPAPRHPVTNPDGWLPQSFFDELEAEVRGPNGVWTQIRPRNESFDLCKMIRAGCLRLAMDKVQDWDSVPAWLAPLARNSEIVTREDRREMQANALIPQPQPRPAMRRPRRHSVASL